MKKILILTILVVAGIGAIYAQAPNPNNQPNVPAGFGNTRVYTEGRTIDIQIKALIPDITIFKLSGQLSVTGPTAAIASASVGLGELQGRLIGPRGQCENTGGRWSSFHLYTTVHTFEFPHASVAVMVNIAFHLHPAIGIGVPPVFTTVMGPGQLSVIGPTAIRGSSSTGG